MKMIKYLPLILIFCLFNGTSVQAQLHHYHHGPSYAELKEMGSPLVKFYQRYDVGYQAVFAPAEFTMKYVDLDRTGMFHTTDIKRKLSSTGSFGIMSGVFFPISHVDRSTIYALYIGTEGNIYSYNVGSVSLDSNSTVTSNAIGMQLAVPMSIDYKYGGDAVRDKSQKLCFAFGFGLKPSLTIMKYGFVASTNASLTPFLKAEVGYFLGICMKLRATMNFGSLKYFDSESSTVYTSYDQMKLGLNGKVSFTLGLVLMPFSWDWDKD
jgi:hypothetical protein